MKHIKICKFIIETKRRLYKKPTICFNAIILGNLFIGKILFKYIPDVLVRKII
jgi:hypothetical protein